MRLRPLELKRLLARGPALVAELKERLAKPSSNFSASVTEAWLVGRPLEEAALAGPQNALGMAPTAAEMEIARGPCFGPVSAAERQQGDCNWTVALTDWLEALCLDDYLPCITTWCTQNGIESLAELIQRRSDLAGDLPLRPLERRRLLERGAKLIYGLPCAGTINEQVANGTSLSDWQTPPLVNLKPWSQEEHEAEEEHDKESLATAVTTWLQSLSLGEYTVEVLLWCHGKRITSLSQVAAALPELAEHLPLRLLERRRLLQRGSVVAAAAAGTHNSARPLGHSTTAPPTLRAAAMEWQPPPPVTLPDESPMSADPWNEIPGAAPVAAAWCTEAEAADEEAWLAAPEVESSAGAWCATPIICPPATAMEEALSEPLAAWLEALALPEQFPAALAWCHEQGILTLKQVVSQRVALAAALPLRPLERRRLEVRGESAALGLRGLSGIGGAAANEEDLAEAWAFAPEAATAAPLADAWSDKQVLSDERRERAPRPLHVGGRAVFLCDGCCQFRSAGSSDVPQRRWYCTQCWADFSRERAWVRHRGSQDTDQQVGLHAASAGCSSAAVAPHWLRRMAESGKVRPCRSCGTIGSARWLDSATG